MPVEAGLHIGAVVDDDPGGEEGAAAFASTREDLGQLPGEARRFASGETEQLKALLLAFREDRVDVAGEHLRKLQSRSVYAGLVSQARVVATALGSPVRLEHYSVGSRDANASVDHQMISSVFDASRVTSDRPQNLA
jgi:hypothetical protein